MKSSDAGGVNGHRQVTDDSARPTGSRSFVLPIGEPDASVVERIHGTAERYRNWGRWGEDDEAGALNYITPDKIAAAARLVRSGKVISLALPFDANGPQTGEMGRINPAHVMLASGTDVAAGKLPIPHGLGFADDAVYMPLQCGTQWDGLSHIFDRGQMWNGYPATDVSAYGGARRNGVEKLANRVVTRGVLLDVARAKGVDSLDDGYAITEDDLLMTITSQGSTSRVEAGDAVMVRTGQMGRCRRDGWGTYAGGDAPGLSFETADWLHRTQIAALATDTWGVEVRPNELAGAVQPLHQVMIPNIGLLIGEIFEFEELANDCANDHIYEFLFVAAPLPVTGAVGSPVNPLALK